MSNFVYWFVVLLASKSYSLVITSIYHFFIQVANLLMSVLVRNWSFLAGMFIPLLLAASYFILHFTANIPYEMCTLILTHEIPMQQVTCLQNDVIVTLACKGCISLTVTFQAETHVLYVELMVCVFVRCLSALSPGTTDVATIFCTECFILITEHFIFLVALRPNADYSPLMHEISISHTTMHHIR